MANKLVRYIIVLLVCLCGTLQGHAQTDSTVSDREVVVAPPDTSTYNVGSNDEKTSSLGKFRHKDILQQVDERKLNGQTTASLKKENAWWYNKNKEQLEDNSNKKGFWYYFLKAITSPAMKIVFWGIVIGAFVLIIVLYLRTFTGRARKIQGVSASTAEVQEDIFSINFDNEVNSALAEHNYRLATRMLFLRVLRTLAEKGVINYGQDKTNMDYLFELGNTRYARDFMQASRNYEYVWYGNFIPAQNQFAQIRQQLDELNQKITN